MTRHGLLMNDNFLPTNFDKKPLGTWGKFEEQFEIEMDWGAELSLQCKATNWGEML